MARGSKIGYRRKTRNKVQLERKGSDESDEDYNVDEDEEFDESEDDYCSSLADDESEESLGEFLEEEEDEEWVEEKVKAKKVGRLKGRKGIQTRKKNGVMKQRKEKVDNSEGEGYDDYSFNGAMKRKKRKVSHKEEKDDDIGIVCRQHEDEFLDEKPRKKSRASRTDIHGDSYREEPKEKDKVSYKEEKEDTEDDDYDESNDSDDEEFTPGEALKSPLRKPVKKWDLRAKNKSNLNELRNEEDDDIGIMPIQDKDEFVDEKPRKKSSVSRTEINGSCTEDHKEKDKVSYNEEKEDTEDDDYDESDDSKDEEFTPGEALKSPPRKPVKKWGLRTKNKSNLKEFRNENPATHKKKTINEWGWGRRKKSTVSSDSDFVISESSDYEYTVSEEEREQVREATELCRRLRTSLRSSNSLKMIKEQASVPTKRKRPERKGKQKVVDLKIEIGKQVCGICLSDEGKRTVRGVLNCCSHYFCFACIMEWSKVESRCPLCKQRFTNISRTARADGGHDVMDAVFPVPERDQVYQPSEEELRGYLDPYENVLCTECQQGGDDALMLLCDLCDSPAHTYCVGLGREVPDGNWYCDGCRPTALASSNAQGLNPDPGATNNLSVASSPVTNVRETFDLNEAYVPETPLSQVSGHSQSPRYSIGHFQPTSPSSGSGAFTLYDRRRIQRQIHQLLNNRSRQSDRNDGVAASSMNLLGSPIGRGVIATQSTIMPARVAPQIINLQGRFADYNAPSLYNREAFSPRLSSLRGEALHNQASTSNGHAFGGFSQSEFAGINARIGGGLGHQQLHPCGSTSNTVADATTSPFQFPEATTVPSRTSQGSLHAPF